MIAITEGWSQLVDLGRRTRLKPYTRLACGHESSPTNTIWIGKDRCKCRRCGDIHKILAAFDAMEKT